MNFGDLETSRYSSKLLDYYDVSDFCVLTFIDSSNVYGILAWIEEVDKYFEFIEVQPKK